MQGNNEQLDVRAFQKSASLDGETEDTVWGVEE